MGFDSQQGGQSRPPQGQQGQWQPQQPGPQAGPRRPKRRAGIAITAVIVAAIAAYAAVSALGKSPADMVTYVVTGDTATVTYGPAGSSLAGSVPMRATAAIGSAPASYYAVDAQLQGSGTVTCEILVGATVVSKSTASGSYTIAICEITRDPLSGQWQDANAG